MPDFTTISPWARGRPGVLAQLEAGCTQFATGHRTATLEQLALEEGLFAQRVDPVWPTLKQRSPEEITDSVFALLAKVTKEHCLVSSIQLYQIFYTDWYMHYGTWRELAATLDRLAADEAQAIQGYFLFWLEHSPDLQNLDAALFFLKRLPAAIELRILFQLAQVSELVSGVASVLATLPSLDEVQRENALITLAQANFGSNRLSIIGFIERVTDPGNKHWLLTEGYDSGVDYHPCAVQAAVLGDMIGSLRANQIDPELLLHHGQCIKIMCDNVGGSPSWAVITDYPDAEEALNLYLSHLSELAEVSEHLPVLKGIYYVLAHDDDNELLSEDAAEKMRGRLDGYFSAPSMDLETRRSWLWWERPEPTLDDLISGEITELNKVLGNIVEQKDEEKMQQLVAWATDFLQLDAAPDLARSHKESLLRVEFNGVRTGGLAAVTDPVLKSVYGQLLLQISQALKHFPTLGGRLLQVGTETQCAHLPEVAAETLANWER